MDQNENGTPGEATADQFTALFDVTGLQVASVTPAPGLATAPLSSFTLAFNQAADPTTLTAATVVLKDPRGNVVPLSFPPTEVSGGANTTFQFSFPNQTASGVYSLSVGPNVKDVAGN